MVRNGRGKRKATATERIHVTMPRPNPQRKGGGGNTVRTQHRAAERETEPEQVPAGGCNGCLTDEGGDVPNGTPGMIFIRMGRVHEDGPALPQSMQNRTEQRRGDE